MPVLLSDDDSESQPHQRRLKWWQYPTKWLATEKFWHEVTTRTVATVLAAAIVYVGAIALGYLALPGSIDTITTAAWVLFTALCLFLALFSVVAMLMGQLRPVRNGIVIFFSVIIIAFLPWVLGAITSELALAVADLLP